MTRELRAFKVFFASPAGLEGERRLFHQTLHEFNEDEAFSRNACLMATGQEAVGPGAGRPQSRINPEIRESDFFVLVLWDRWGSPPNAAGEPGYTSGTEEEYEIARECLLGDFPMRDIVVLFKGVPARQLSDPGDQLASVLEFKARLEREKSLMYATFDNRDEYRRLLQQQYLRWLREGDETGPLSRESVPPSPRGPAAGEDELAATNASERQLLSEVEQLADDGDVAAAEERYAQLVAESPSLAIRREYARFLRRNNRFALADQVSEQLIAAGEGAGDTEAVVHGLANLAISKRKHGDLDESEDLLRRAMATAERGPPVDRATLAYLANNLGLTLRRKGEFEEAQRLYARAAELYEGLDNKVGLAHAHNNASFLARERGRFDAAHEHAEAALAAARAANDRMNTASALCNLGLVLAEEEDLQAAEDRLREALDLNTQQPDPGPIALSYVHLARVCLANGSTTEASELADRALGLSERLMDPEGLAMALHVAGQIALQRRSFDQADRILSEARQLYLEMGYRLGVIGPSVDLARLRAKEGRLHEAQQLLTEEKARIGSLEHAGLRKRMAAVETEVSELAARRRPPTKLHVERRPRQRRAGGM